MKISDQREREQALDRTQSYIVQAPAGSGKTELLIQRYLSLLAVVDAPEDVLALTFTRRTAAEMRHRVIDALRLAGEPDPAPGHALACASARAKARARLTGRLAREALSRSIQCGWDIERQTARLRIMTIDSLNASCVNTLPLLSGMGLDVDVVGGNAAFRFYEEAIREVLDMRTAPEEIRAALQTLLLHCNNDDRRIVELIRELLVSRDQWLRHLTSLRVQSASSDIRGILTDLLANAFKKELSSLRALLPASLGQDMVEIARESALRLMAEGKSAPHIDCHDRHGLPGADIVDIPYWRALAGLFLKKNNEQRVSFTAREGFGKGPAGQKDKERLRVISDDLARQEGLLGQWGLVRSLPDVVYTDDQWQLLEALIRLLPVCAAHLRRVFQRHGVSDFIEQAQGVLRMGGPSGGIERHRGYSTRHILMDEFQDTSRTQFHLLEQFIADWRPGDGRSLFLVGDPMQSIYGFREADVNGFLRVREQGIRGLRPQFLCLETNFRSTPSLVEWFNRIFPTVLAEKNDLSCGGVCYSPAVSALEDIAESGVHVCAERDRSQEEEARQIVAVVRRHLQREPGHTIGILARTREHLSRVYDRLLREEIPFQAFKIFALSTRPSVQDWLAVLRSLLHRHDRMAWLAVLRAPWCGLTLDSLHRLCADEPEKDLWTLMNTAEVQCRLSDDERQRLMRIIGVYRQIFEQARHFTFRARLEWLWGLLGAAECHVKSGRDIDVCFDLLGQIEQSGQVISLPTIERLLKEEYSRAGNDNDCRVHLMTIHSSKGKQFDTVILPGLERKGRDGDKPLLVRHDEGSGEGRLLLAPLSGAGIDSSSYDYVRGYQTRKNRYELQRLLYVAATRARRHLYLFAMRNSSEGKDKKGVLHRPASSSLLALFGDQWDDQFIVGGGAISESEKGVPSSVVLKRVSADWQPSSAVVNVAGRCLLERRGYREPVEFSWSGQVARQVGVVVHRYLHQLAEVGTAFWFGADTEKRRRAVSACLQSSGSLPKSRLEPAIERVIEVVNHVLNSERGQWLLASYHEARSEYAVSGLRDQCVVHRVIDRTFIDERGVRWIVDYKTGFHEGGGREEFLDNEQVRYRFQLEEYADLMAAGAHQDIRLGLYFPMVDGWREWSY